MIYSTGHIQCFYSDADPLEILLDTVISKPFLQSTTPLLLLLFICPDINFYLPVIWVQVTYLFLMLHFVHSAPADVSAEDATAAHATGNGVASEVRNLHMLKGFVLTNAQILSFQFSNDRF